MLRPYNYSRYSKHYLLLHVHPSVLTQITPITILTPSEGELGIVMEYVDGNDLHHYAQNQFKKVNAEWILRVAKEIAMAMQFLHRQDVSHRDLKPANVLITQKGKAKVADFGLAKVVKMLQSLVQSWI